MFLCYDTDVFEFEQHPKINWLEVEKILNKNGAKKVIQIKAKKSIEDWFLCDTESIIRFPKLPSNTKVNGRNGQEKIKNLFKKLINYILKVKSVMD